MGKKKGSSKSNGKGFDRNLSLVEAANQVVKPFVEQKVAQLGMQLHQEQTQTLRAIYTRLTTLEGLIQDKFDIDDEALAELVADTEDRGQNLFKQDGEAKEGDTLRITVSTKMDDQEEFQGESKLLVDSLGIAPFTIGPELEPQLIGLKMGQVVELKFGEDNKMVAQVTINRISRRPEVKESESLKETESLDENAG